MASASYELSNFSASIREEVNNQIQRSGGRGFQEAAFTRLVMEYLSDAEQTGNIQECTVVHRNKSGNRLRQVNGYGIWDNFETLDLFITDYSGEGELYTMDRASIASAFNLVQKYLQYLLKGDTELIEESSIERELHQNFNGFKDNIARVRLIFLTDGLVKSNRKSDIAEPPAGVGNYAVTTEIWDLERIHQLYSSQRKREAIEMDVVEQFGQKISCLTVDQDTNSYTTYLGIVPATFLADLYDIYGSRLLEQNVRVYLQSVGKINKEIRRTIIKSPGMFMAYNNGISATATSVSMETDQESDRQIIRNIKGLQIVNGGQTTSSVYYARKKDRADLSKVNVQMKITVVPDNQKMEEVVGKISKYANSQNKVSETDLTSNQSFHITLEELSRTTWAEMPTTGNQTRWYYERVKGQYKEEVNREHTPTRQKAFKEKNPIQQVLRKEELAKFRNSWAGFPQRVAKGSQKNYMMFIDEEKFIEPSRSYFKDTVAIAILFKEAERLYGKKPDSMGDIRYLAVPYSLAWLNYHTHGKIDLEQLWRMQGVSPALSEVMKEILFKVNTFLQTSGQQGALIGEWAKKDECWDMMKVITPEKWGIDFSSMQNLMTRDSAPSSVKFDAGIAEIPVEEWEAIAQFGADTNHLNPMQVWAVRNIIERLHRQKGLSEQLIRQGSDARAIYIDYLES